MIDQGKCDKGFVWNPSNSEFKCDKSEYKHCKCRNKSVDKLVEDCSENIDGNEMIYND